jgi:methylmalonyl-CoA/ethylmalonyl-CoA epimerase
MATVQVSGVGQVAVMVKDVDRATAFYEQVLGLKLLFRYPGMAFFDAGGFRLYLAKPETPSLDHTSIVYYRVADVRAATAALEQAGVTVVHPARVVHRDAGQELWMAFFRDPEGNTFALMAEMRPE